MTFNRTRTILTTPYNKDGTKLFEEYDENQDVVREILYATDGTQTVTEYDEFGDVIG